MTAQGISCLFCRTELEIMEEPKNKKEARTLNQIHKRLCSAMKLDFPKEFRKWNFSSEPFPFCLNCQKVILRLCRLMDQLKALELQISRCVSTLSMLTITSKLNSVKSQMMTAPEDASISEKCHRKLVEEKHQYFRDVIIRRFKTRVRIKRCDQSRHLLKAKVGSPIAVAHTNATEEIRSECPRANVITIENTEVEGDIRSESSTVPPETVSPIWNVKWDSYPVVIDDFQEPLNSNSSETPAPLSHSNAPKATVPSDSEPVTVGCDNSEIPNNSFPKGPSRTNEILESAEHAKEVITAQEPRQQQSAPLEEISEACELDIKIEPLADPSDHSGQSTIDPRNKDQRACASAIKNQRGKRRGQKARSRIINPRHVRKAQLYKVNRLSEGFYELNGYGFKELDNGYECSTCQETASFPPRWPKPDVKWRNIKNHIEKTHILTHTPDLYRKSSHNVEVVDKERKRSRLLGHEFQELEMGYECSTCKKIFPFAPLTSEDPKWKNIKAHIFGAHKYKGHGRCEICNAEVKDLSQHMKGVHCGETDRKVCEVCGKEFKSLINLNSHRSIVHRRSQQEKKFHCDDCGNKFRTKASLMIHQRIHGGEKPYVCEHCGKTFRFSHVLKTHVASAHGERKFACDQCDWKFGVKFLLNRHAKQVHQGIKPPPPPPKRKKAEVPMEESEEETPEESDFETTSAGEEKA